jgi:hypothetical protein
MSPDEIIRKRRESMEVFKLARKADAKAVHRTINRPPKGKGWVQGVNMPEGLMCRPDGVRESIELYKKAYAIFPDIVLLNQIAIACEMIGELESAREFVLLMKAQAEREGNKVYAQAADMQLARLGNG